MSVLKVLTGGAYRAVLLAAIPAFERETGRTVTLVNDTVGALVRRIAAGEAFDVLIASPAAVADLIAQKKVLPDVCVPLARVGIGVMVKTGAAKPNVGTVAAFKQALLNARSIAYIDPKSGGSSGIYIDRLLSCLGIAEALKDRIKLKRGGHVSDLILSGEAELGIHQMSEIVATAGVTLAGPLPADIQNYTTYAAALSPTVRDRPLAEALIATLAGPATADVLAVRGMLRP